MADVLFKGQSIHTNGILPTVNSPLPNFKLTDKNLGEKSLNDFKGKRKLLSFVPSLDTPVCSLSAKKFNEVISSIPEVVVLVISCDLPFAQGRFCSQEHINNIVTLSMMKNRDCAAAYGILIQDGPLAGLCARAVVIADANDKILYTELVPEITQEPNYDQALSVLRKT